MDVLSTVIVTLFNIENLRTFSCANEGVQEPFYHFYAYNSVGRNDEVGIVPSLRARGSVDRIPMGATFPENIQTSLSPTKISVQGLPGLFPGVKRPMPCVDHPYQSNVEIKERVHLYFYSLHCTHPASSRLKFIYFCQ